MKEKKAGSLNKFLAAIGLLVIAGISGWSLKSYINPVLSVFTQTPTDTSVVEVIPEETLESLIEQRDSWEVYTFDTFELNLPEFESEDLDENTKQIAVKDPESGEYLVITIYRAEAKQTGDVTELLPEEESDLYGFTMLGEYEALRVGLSDPPYYEVSYFINEDGYIYEINAKFNTPVSFVDQVLSSFKII